MREVTQDEFFAVVGPLNVTPRAERYESVWEVAHTRVVIGKTTPGYLCVDGQGCRQPRRYFLAARASDTREE